MLLVIHHNARTGRFHPFAFGCSPAPSDGDGPSFRYRSRFHHTEGFATEVEARDFAVDTMVPHALKTEASARLLSGVVEDAWDVDEVPARTMRERPMRTLRANAHAT